jgi:nucleotide-binding universal stress UspA family protein
MRLERILVPTDFSAFSLQALNDAIDLGKPFKARIILLHSMEPIYFASSADLYGPPTNLAVLVEEQRRGAQEQLAGLARGIEKRGLLVQTVLVCGTPHAEIVGAAKKQGADLIVMSTHGRSGFSHLLMGSVAERVVRGAACPVLTVRADGGARAGAAKQAERQRRPA